MSATAAAPPTRQSPSSFSERLKSATWGDHEAAEQHGFTQALIEGDLPLDGYTAMVAQHYFAYLALEEVGRALSGHPVTAPFLQPELERVPALEQDLAHLLGDGWQDLVRPSAPTRTYVARLHQMADHPAGFVAHHYTRYLGDVSGGQFISRAARRTYGLTDGAGVRFYDFRALGSLPKFRARYRESLDALELPEAEEHFLLREARLAYQLNTEVLADLGRVCTP
ncbi:biliverdin-producing heme oxygenase [Nocardiopsis kunsanensis]|uniref:Biliverdin-producing heme oxygenase n=1 Tax=Nocardiopsis kunsanensis TaxID=141693 RepID=A0A918XA35_9ACTN|nr:biliverdin-producing heme oxygenase [Nocardiopsis kunsanensis]GHD21080.1 biliverdin-producing heme oxygenase [Nocardiopsis kunsanensis]